MNITKHHGHIDRLERVKLYGKQNCVLWFAGLSGAGKSTIAYEVERKLIRDGRPAYVLDGDNIRHGLNKNLGFSPEDREENLRRIIEVAKLFYDAGITVIVSFISPYRSIREKARTEIGENFFEVFIDCPLEVCEKRDVKGLYKKARAGDIKDFTGISAPFEMPEHPEIHVHTDENSVEECVQRIIEHVNV